MSRTGENIYKRKDGRWEARYIDSYDGNGKAKYKYLFVFDKVLGKTRIMSLLSSTSITSLG